MPGARVTSGRRTTLRTVEREDIEFLQLAYANPELRYPLGWEAKSRSQLEAEFDEEFGDDEAFLVCLDEADDGAPRRIGCVVLGTHELARTGLGFWLVPSVHGEGYGREAVALAIDYVFRTYPHPAVRATVLPGNEASRGLLESLGFSQEGRARREAFWDGEYRDAILYGLLREEWEREREQ